jgi:hypothetical protein
MLIHNSHTKETLIKIIRLLELDIKYSNQLKDNLKEDLADYCDDNSNMIFKKNVFHFRNMKNLVDYLTIPSTNVKNCLSVKEKEKLINTARRLINFVECGCDYDYSIFNNEEELHNNIIYVCKFGGSLSTCRRSIKTINETLPSHKHYEIDIDYETQLQLDQRDMKKFLKTPQFQIKKKKISLSFN